MRLMSFMLTTEQIRNQTKTVTRRLGWATLRSSTLVQPIVKGQGLKKGEKVEKIGGPIRIVNVRRETLDRMFHAEYGRDEVIKEGFPHLLPSEFTALFCNTHGHTRPWDTVTRIEFEYVEPLRPACANLISTRENPTDCAAHLADGRVEPSEP